MFTEAERLNEIGDVDSALMIYFVAAELGVEVAESNVAFLLEQGKLSNRVQLVKTNPKDGQLNTGHYLHVHNIHFIINKP